MNSYIKREYDYAIRICAYLAGQEPGKAIPLSKIVSNLMIPKPFATKITHKLKKAGVTGSVQGKTGGIYLNKDPHRLSVLDILKAMEFDSTLNECIYHHDICPLVGVCHIHHFFREEERRLLKNFENKKLADLAIQASDIAVLFEETQ